MISAGRSLRAALRRLGTSGLRTAGSQQPRRWLATPTSFVTGDAEADTRELRALFDSPQSPSTSAASSSSASISASSSVGLFGSPSLTSPQSFLDLAQRTLIRAQLLVSRIANAPQNGEAEMRRVVRNLDRLSDLLCGVIDCAELVRNAHPDPAWVDAANAAYEHLCGYMNVLNTHTGLYSVLSQVVHAPQLRNSLSSEALAVAMVFLRDFEKSGIHLPEQARQQFVELSDEILVLGRHFLQGSASGERKDAESEAAAAEEAEQSVVEMPLELLQGTPAPVLDALVASSSNGKVLQLQPGAWEWQAISKYSPNEQARLYAYRALNRGNRTQVKVLEALLRKRAELARLTGHESFAAMTLTDKMARNPSNVDGFLGSLAAHHRPRAERTLSELRALKADKSKVTAWDRDYLAEQHLRQLGRASTLASIPISPFFSVGTIFAGLSRLFESLYGIRLRAASPPASEGEVWSKDVMKMDVVDQESGVIGTIYADLYARSGKPSSAAHYTVRCSRRTDDDDALADYTFGSLADEAGHQRQITVEQGEHQGLARALQVPTSIDRTTGHAYQLPVVVLLCDFVRPSVQTGPSLLSWHEVETLFHEMGHAIHSMIGRTEYHNVSGTRCATDFVELPSILMEHFVSSPQVVELMARHHATDAALPYHHLTTHLRLAKSLEALDTHHQILLASLDQLYHSPLALEERFDSTDVVHDLESRIGLVEYPSPQGAAMQRSGGKSKDVAWQGNFGHLFGYGATYYAYLFDRAVAARVWQCVFGSGEHALSREHGERFKRGVLQHGGGRDPWELLGGTLQDDEIARGDHRAMQSVGKWGISDLAQAQR